MHVLTQVEMQMQRCVQTQTTGLCSTLTVCNPLACAAAAAVLPHPPTPRPWGTVSCSPIEVAPGGGAGGGGACRLCGAGDWLGAVVAVRPVGDWVSGGWPAAAGVPSDDCGQLFMLLVAWLTGGLCVDVMPDPDTTRP
jgi:hypothetical protein